jgi:FkbH-like protein
VPTTSNLSIFKVEDHLKLLHQEIFNKLADNIKIIRQDEAVKIIVIDLDDTLWRGVAAEDSIEGPLRSEGWPLGFIEALLYFKRRGGLLAIASKNEPESTAKRFEEICGDRIKLHDFVSVKINWNPKSQSIDEILRETNLLPESALFIDDNPREIDEVRAHFPTLRCLGGNHHDWRRIILRSPETQVAGISRESRDRTRLVRARIDREVASRALSRHEWLLSLKIKQHISMVNDIADKSFGRAIELINKTNQFNTTGKRWTSGELDEFFRNGGCCLTTDLRDKTIDNGMIGVALIKPGALIQVVLSCRVFGLGAEITMGSIATTVALRGQAFVRSTLIDTGKNFTCHDYFERLGFRRDGDEFVTDTACSTPPWIEFSLSKDLEAC